MLRKRLQEIETRMNAIHDEIEGAENVAQIDGLRAEYDTLAEERNQIIPALEVVPVGSTRIERGPGFGNPEERSGNVYASVEYREAFRNFMQTRNRAELDRVLESRADATTLTTDLSAVIPTTIQDRVIEALVSYGGIFARITKTNINGGVAFPISSLNPEAVWLAEGSTAEKKKLQSNTSVQFSYYKLQVKIATSIEASVASLEMYEKLVAEKLVRAIIVALETAVIKGSGVGQPLGITTDPRITQKVSVKLANLKYDTFLSVLAKIDSAYDTRDLVWLMNRDTFFTNVLGLVGTDGQPVARVNHGIDGKPEHIFLGRNVILTSEIKSVTAVTPGATPAAVFAVLGDLSEYAINSNLQLTVKKYFDEDTDEWIDKATLIADGKPLDAGAFALLLRSAD